MISSTGTRSSARSPARPPSRHITRAMITWSPRRTSTCVPLAICRPVWIIRPRDEMLRMQASLHAAPWRSLAGTATRRRSSRGFREDFETASEPRLARTRSPISKALFRKGYELRCLRRGGGAVPIALAAWHAKLSALPRPRPHPPLFADWSALGPNARRSLSQCAAAELEARADAFVEAMADELRASEPWARFNVMLGAGMVREAAALTTQITGEVIPSDKPGLLVARASRARWSHSRDRALECSGDPRLPGDRVSARLRQYGDPQGL